MNSLNLRKIVIFFVIIVITRNISKISVIVVTHLTLWYFQATEFEKVYEEISNLFPNAKISVLSSDKVKNKILSHEIKDIINNKVEIIIGTQIISKGHNFPYLKTVGILNIDSILNDFDFRSNERAYQQITQVAGRAGRKNINGEVFIQTFQPYHPVNC